MVYRMEKQDTIKFISLLTTLQKYTTKNELGIKNLNIPLTLSWVHDRFADRLWNDSMRCLKEGEMSVGKGKGYSQGSWGSISEHTLQISFFSSGSGMVWICSISQTHLYETT